MSWPLVKLGSVATVNPRIPKDTDESQLVTFLGMASVSESGELITQETRVFSETKKGFTYFERHDVLLAKITPCFENGKAALVNNLEHQIGFGSTEFHVLRAAPAELDPKYLFYLVWSNQFRFIGEAAMKGAAGQKRISVDFLKDFEIPLPPLSEQKRIAAILDKADSIRRKRQQAIKLADDFLRSVFLEMFGDPVTNPKGWEVKSLKDLASKIGSGSTPRGGKEAYISEGISLIRSLNIHDDEFVHKNLAFITDKQAKELSNVTIEKNDVLLNITGASVCRCALVDNSVLPARVNQHVCIIRPKDMEPEYLLHMLISTSYKQQLLRIAQSAGATREALTKDQVENLKIPVPPQDLQRKFSTIKGGVKAMLAKAQYSNEIPLFESLSQKAFSGMI